jgi:cyclohexadienyl dehydratase
MTTFVAFASTVPLTTAHAQTTKLDEIIQRGTLRVGLTGDYRPFSIKAEDGTFTGLDVDQANALAAALGVRLEIVPTAWPTLMADLQAGKYDIGMGGITESMERAKTAFFSVPVMRSGKTPIARCVDRDKYETLDAIDHPGVRVITNPGGTNEKFDRAHLHAAQIIVFPSNATIFDELAAGHADLMITDGVETRLQQKLHSGVLCAIHPDHPFDTSELGYMLPRDIALKLFVDLWIHQSEETGRWQMELTKWLGE